MLDKLGQHVCSLVEEEATTVARVEAYACSVKRKVTQETGIRKRFREADGQGRGGQRDEQFQPQPVSYTHLTLPTNA